MVRADVSFSENEVKAIFGVKAHCLRNNPLKGRTIWGWTQTGLPFRTTELCAYYGWDEANALKWLRRPLAYGLLRKKEDTGQLGIGACVPAKLEPEPKPDPVAAEIDLLVRTDKLPPYLAKAKALVASKTKEERDLFLQNVWRPIKAKYQKQLNAEKQRLYDLEQHELTEQCKAFDPQLPSLKRKPPKKARKTERTQGSHLSVRTSKPESCTEPPGPLYKAENGSVRTRHIRNERKGQEYRGPSSSLVAVAQRKLVEHCGQVDDDVAQQMVADCQQRAPDCTEAEVEHFIDEKAKLINREIRNPAGFLRTAVPKCFDPNSLNDYRERKRLKERADEEERERARRAHEENLAYARERLADPTVPEDEKAMYRRIWGDELKKPAAEAREAGQQ